ncbi:DUF2968 domain-containing protein [Trinickia acidisoli]|uniref:DUF2968 domain-containing protein n=1 Tax=Trinickia acidisoli TaxID=2767482 RepID=UPI001A8C7A0B|nr:DUF2968 domain-containing protein [Trinickia acidisoli]
MSHYSRMRGTALAALIAIGGLGINGCATAQSAADGAANVAPAVTVASAPAAPVVAAVPPASTQLSTPVTAPDQAPAADEATDGQGDVAELQRLMHGTELSELRTAYNGTYGASLLLHGKDMTYYVVLFQQKNFWRVIKTTNEDYAEAVYGDFVRRSAQLADVEINRTILAAQKVYTDELIAKAQARADRLQADLDVAHKQQALAVSRQKQAREEAAALQTQKLAAQEQLNSVQQQIHLLQRETDQGLPGSHAHTHQRRRKH